MEVRTNKLSFNIHNTCRTCLIIRALLRVNISNWRLVADYVHPSSENWQDGIFHGLLDVE